MRWIVRCYRWHVLAFLALNATLAVSNVLMGGPWWSFWPLIVTGFLLAIHYFFYKSLVVDESWVEERAQELNLKSYDRGHIEDLKTRYSGGGDLSKDQR